jgi:hypothetical protein
MVMRGKNGRRINPKSLENLNKATQWKKGQSGNPSGKGKAHFDVAKQSRKSGPAVVKFWQETMNDPKMPIGQRMKASENLMSRGFGLPVNPLHMQLETHTDHKTDHLAALIAVNREVAEHQRLGKSNGTEVSEEPSYLYATSDDDAEDTQPE